MNAWRDQKPARTRAVKMHRNRLENQGKGIGHYSTASEAKNPAVRLGFGVSEGREFFGPRTGERKCVSWRFCGAANKEKKVCVLAFRAGKMHVNRLENQGKGIGHYSPLLDHSLFFGTQELFPSTDTLLY